MTVMNRTIAGGGSSAVLTYEIYQDGGIGDSQPQNMPGTEWQSQTLTSVAWGFLRQDLPVINTRLSNGQRLGIEQVRVEQTLKQMLTTILTLGFVAPVTISWRGSRPVPEIGILD
jgi:hypothetical protein